MKQSLQDKGIKPEAGHPCLTCVDTIAPGRGDRRAARAGCQGSVTDTNVQGRIIKNQSNGLLAAFWGWSETAAGSIRRHATSALAADSAAHKNRTRRKAERKALE